MSTGKGQADNGLPSQMDRPIGDWAAQAGSNQEIALAAFVRSKTEIDAPLAPIVAASDDHFGTNPAHVTEVPVIELAHLSETQTRACVIADNRLAVAAGWDDDLLRIELAKLRDDGFDLALTGFDPGEIAGFLG